MWGKQKEPSPRLTTRIKRITVRIHQTRRLVQLDDILHVIRFLVALRRLGHIHVCQHPHNGPVHARYQRLVVRHRPVVHHARARLLRAPGRQPPKGRADHDDFGRAPGHEGRNPPPVVVGLALRQQMRREVVALLHAGESRGRRQRAQPRGPVGRHADLGAVDHLLEHGRHGGAAGGRLEEGGVPVGGVRGFDVLDHAEEVLLD